LQAPIGDGADAESFCNILDKSPAQRTLPSPNKKPPLFTYMQVPTGGSGGAGSSAAAAASNPASKTPAAKSKVGFLHHICAHYMHTGFRHVQYEMRSSTFINMLNV